LSASAERRMPRRDGEVFLFGTAMASELLKSKNVGRKPGL
jgi:hypothetical protein